MQLVVFSSIKHQTKLIDFSKIKYYSSLTGLRTKNLNHLTKKTVAFVDEGPSNSDTKKIMARMDAMTMKMDAEYKEMKSRSNSISKYDEDDQPMTPEVEPKFMQTFRRTHFYNDYRDSNHDNWRSSERNDYNRDNYLSNSDDKPYDVQRQLNDFVKSQQSTNAFVKDTFMDFKSQLKTIIKNHQASIQNLEAKFDRLADKQSARPSGSLPSNTQPNPKGSSSKPYQPPEYEEEEFAPPPKSKTPKLVKETPIPKPYKPRIPYPQCLRKEKMEAQYGKFLDIIQAVRINVPLVDVLAEMPNYGKFLKELATDLGASINLMPYSIYTKLSLKTLKPTKMSVRLADKSFQHPIGIAENMLVEVGKFTFPVDFVILEMKEDMTTDENSESESDEDEPKFKKITINTDHKIKTYLEKPPTDLELKPLPDNLEHVFLEEPSFLLVIISSQLFEQNKNKLVSVLKNEKKPVVQKQRRLNPNMLEVVKKEIVKLLDTEIIYPIADSPWVSPIRYVPKKGGITVVTNEKDELVPTRTITGTDNVAADHLSRIENDETSNDSDIDDNFPEETLMKIDTHDEPWFADFANYLAGSLEDISSSKRTKIKCLYILESKIEEKKELKLKKRPSATHK
ncbi:reverse transcriptase domain-containing protein [Tanacetum coccineum]